MHSHITENLYDYLVTHTAVERSEQLTSSPEDEKLQRDDIDHDRHKMLFDVLKKDVIDPAVHFVKINNINAKISNVAFNVRGQLIIAQVYVERKNGFAAVQGGQFGTSPTIYNVQLRFPFGLNMRLGEKDIFLPRGDFVDVLESYPSHNHKICDDVQRDTDPREVICGPGIAKEIDEASQTVTLKVVPEGEFISFSYSNEIGKGYYRLSLLPPEYYQKIDYDRSLKIKGVYPLFSVTSKERDKKKLLHVHDDYPGSTYVPPKYTTGDYFESPTDGKVDERKDNYHVFLEKFDREIKKGVDGKPNPVSERWIRANDHLSQDTYLFNIYLVNDTAFFAGSWLPVVRLRDYQLELFQNSLQFIKAAQNGDQKRSGKINMGVGAGKTYSTYTLLQRIQYDMQQRNCPPSQIAPPFCMAPDRGVAEVTEKTINFQGSKDKTGKRSIAITGKSHLPSDAFTELYQSLTDQAKEEAKEIDNYIQTGLQNDILEYCRERSLYPYMFINLLFNRGGTNVTERAEMFKDSVDIKRLVLLVEGQKLILKNLGLSGIDVLNGLLEQFEAIEERIKIEQQKEGSFFKGDQDEKKEIKTFNQTLAIKYDEWIDLKGCDIIAKGKLGRYDFPINSSQTVLHLYEGDGELFYYINDTKYILRELDHKSKQAILELIESNKSKSISDLKLDVDQQQACEALLNITYQKNHTQRKSLGTINLAEMTEAQLKEILNKKHKLNIRAVRDALIKIAFLADQEAAILLANSGGMGNTYSDKELEGQINQFLPLAIKQLTGLAKKKPLSHHDHYTMYMYLRELYTKIPSSINYSDQLIKQDIDQQQLYRDSLHDHVQLISHIKNRIKDRLKKVKKVGDLKDYKDHSILNTIGINHDASILKAADQLAGVAALRITGHAANDNAKLLLSHVPIFTPEGLAAYFESLDRLVGTPKVNFRRVHGIYTIDQKNNGSVSKDDIKARIQQILNAVMIADEVHKNEFRFLYDVNDPIYTSINKITLKYLNKRFIDVLPIRIGMSGTCNSVTEQAFGQTTLYDLSIQKMIQKGLVKKINVFCNTSESKSMEEYAKQIVIDYFSCSVIDLFKISKGLIFSKEQDEKLNSAILKFFNLLIEENPETSEQAIQDELFLKINEKRGSGRPPLTCDGLREIHRNAFYNNLFAVYLEYLLSKSSEPKEFSDIIGLQNKLYNKKKTLIDGIQDEKEILALIRKIDPNSITREDLNKFIDARIKDNYLSMKMVGAFLQSKNNVDQFVRSIHTNFADVPLNQLATNQRADLESGKTLVMLGGASEQTGYSHEPIGIIVEAPANNHQFIVAQSINRLRELKEEEISPFLQALQTIVKNTFSYDEKNQAGGRALRTPYGHVQYIQYQTAIKQYVDDNKIERDNPLMAFKVETSFEDIFTDDEAFAEAERISISFNREVLLLLENSFLSLNDFSKKFSIRFSEVFGAQFTKERYENYIHQRLPLLWAMKYQPQMALEYFKNKDIAIFDGIKNELAIDYYQHKKGQSLPSFTSGMTGPILPPKTIQPIPTKTITEKLAKYDNTWWLPTFEEKYDADIKSAILPTKSRLKDRKVGTILSHAFDKTTFFRKNRTREKLENIQAVPNSSDQNWVKEFIKEYTKINCLYRFFFGNLANFNPLTIILHSHDKTFFGHPNETFNIMKRLGKINDEGEFIPEKPKI